MPKQQLLKSPLLLWITGGEILHPAFYSYLPAGLLFLCGRARASALLFSSPSARALRVCRSVCGRKRQCVPVKKSLHVLVAQHDLCVWVCRACASTHTGIAAGTASAWLMDHAMHSFVSADHNTPLSSTHTVQHALEIRGAPWNCNVFLNSVWASVQELACMAPADCDQLHIPHHTVPCCGC